MKLARFLSAAAILSFGIGGAGYAQEPAPTAPVEKQEKPEKKSLLGLLKKKKDPAENALNQAALEEKFRTTLEKAKMTGRFSVVKDGKNEASEEETYTISGVTKLLGDNWVVRARIQYGQRDVTVPVPVKVLWAGDTPVITVDGFGIPGGKAAYSARVLIYGDAYAGTWSAGDHGGLMSGVITRE